MKIALVLALLVAGATSYSIPGTWDKIYPSRTLLDTFGLRGEIKVHSSSKCRLTVNPDSEIVAAGSTAEQLLKVKIVCDQSVNAGTEMQDIVSRDGLSFNVSTDCDSSVSWDSGMQAFKPLSPQTFNVSSVCGVTVDLGNVQQKLKSSSNCQETIIPQSEPGDAEQKSKVSVNCDVTAKRGF